MRKIYYFLAIFVTLAFVSCNDDVKDEQYRQLVSLKANIDGKGVTPTYIRYKTDGKVVYDLPIIISGTTTNKTNMNVKIGVDSDTLKSLNQERFSTRTELFYKELESNYFSIPESGSVNSGKSTGIFPITFSLQNLDLGDKWLLPLSVLPDANYEINSRLHYSKALLRIMPFNDYSGDYNATAFKMYFKNNNEDPIVADTKTTYVVDENTIFMYAGIMDEEYTNRKEYKIIMRFNEDKTLSISTDNPAINLNVVGTPKYLVEEEMDIVLPYLKHKYITLELEYDFTDLSIPGFPIDYTMKGILMMERKINTQIPDEDQAIQW